MPVLVAENITAGYGRTPIINEISVSVNAGEVSTIVGPNGAGKSTFAKALVGVLKITNGSVRVDGIDITKMRGHLIPRNGLVYVPQNYNVFSSMTVTENLEIGGFAAKGDTSARMNEILGIFKDLEIARHKKAGFLSGGQQNLLAIARALMVSPKAIILDEPTAGLSPAYTDVVWNQVQTIANTGTAVLVVEQNVERALKHSDFVHIFVAGSNLVSGSIEKISKLDLAGIFLGRAHATES
jgi:branched-chain amino acid transport system ATP-binding protein